MDVQKTSVAQVEVAYTVMDGGYVFMDRFTYPAAKPMDAKAVDAKIAASYATWRVVMDTPIPVLTRADLQAQLARAAKARTAAEAEMATLTARIASIAEVRGG